MGKHIDANIVITGGSRGIGRATALQFAKEGAGCIFLTASRNANETILTLNQLRNMGTQAYAFPCDVGNESSVQSFFQYIHTKCNYIDHIVHAAGISPNQGFFDHTAELWNEVLRVNTTGSFLVAKHAKNILRASKSSITLITSTNGINSYAPYSAAYDSSKAAINILVKNLSEALRDKRIRVNGIAPGWVDTTLNDTLPPGEREKEIARIFLSRFARPDEIASVCTFLASRDASYINGTILMVDGGYR